MSGAMTGAMTYRHDLELSPTLRDLKGVPRLVNAVEVRMGSIKDVALWDTGSGYTILSESIAEALEADGRLEWLDVTMVHRSREGEQRARTAKCNITLIADLWGEDLLLEDVTVLVPPRWRELIVLGAITCIERINFAVVEAEDGYGVSREYSFLYFAKRSG
jgi:hypothetical protein